MIVRTAGFHVVVEVVLATLPGAATCCLRAHQLLVDHSRVAGSMHWLKCLIDRSEITTSMNRFVTMSFPSVPVRYRRAEPSPSLGIDRLIVPRNVHIRADR